jgi:hypothetical protein
MENLENKIIEKLNTILNGVEAGSHLKMTTIL